MRWSRTAGLLLALAAGAAAGVTAVRAAPPEPPAPRDLPGQQAARIEFRWVGPYVLAIGLGLGGKSGRRTGWHAPDGAVVRDAMAAGEDFVVVEGKDGATTVHGTRAPWTISFPPKAPAASKVELVYAASGDGRTFVRQQTSLVDSTTSADVFVD